MNKFFVLIVCVLQCLCCNAGQITIEQCEALARENYPLIKKYGLIDRMRSIELSDVNKGWLPRIGIYAQATVQNVVPGFPESMQPMLHELGVDLPGLRKDQYRVGVDVSQTIWDGGKSKADRDVAYSESAAQSAANDVEMYAVRQQVQDLYFAVLLTDAQIEQVALMADLLKANLDKLRSMYDCGTVMQSDVDAVEAQYLATCQNAKRLDGMRRGYCRALELFVGQPLDGKTFICPQEVLPEEMTCRRPELDLFDAQKKANNARRSLVEVATMPHIGFFAQGYYGYPGYDYFASMGSRSWTVNLLAGVKVSWTLDSFYNKGNNKSKLWIKDELTDNGIEVFRRNNAILSAQQQEEVRSRRSLMEEDERIVALRTRVRKAAEARLDNGVIDTTDLLDKITEESTAAVNAAYHHIEYVRSIYQLKYTLNQ